MGKPFSSDRPPSADGGFRGARPSHCGERALDGPAPGVPLRDKSLGAAWLRVPRAGARPWHAQVLGPLSSDGQQAARQLLRAVSEGRSVAAGPRLPCPLPSTLTVHIFGMFVSGCVFPGS